MKIITTNKEMHLWVCSSLRFCRCSSSWSACVCIFFFPVACVSALVSVTVSVRLTAYVSAYRCFCFWLLNLCVCPVIEPPSSLSSIHDVADPMKYRLAAPELSIVRLTIPWWLCQGAAADSIQRLLVVFLQSAQFLNSGRNYWNFDAKLSIGRQAGRQKCSSSSKIDICREASMSHSQSTCGTLRLMTSKSSWQKRNGGAMSWNYVAMEDDHHDDVNGRWSNFFVHQTSTATGATSVHAIVYRRMHSLHYYLGIGHRKPFHRLPGIRKSAGERLCLPWQRIRDQTATRKPKT